MITEAQIERSVDLAVKNFLHEYRNNTTNKQPLRKLNETTSLRMLQRHSQDGYIIISPCRSTLSPQENNKRIKEMINNIKRLGFSYTPVYGGYIENRGLENEKEVYERSFVIYNRNKDGKPLNINDLYNFGVELARKYNQESFLFKAPNETPKYITQDREVDMDFVDPTSFNDVTKSYFTSMYKDPEKIDRFSFNECYINPKPVTYTEGHSRYMTGEVF